MYYECDISGCESCNCDSVGSYNRSCDLTTGQCLCKPGVGGRRCESCQVIHRVLNSFIADKMPFMVVVYLNTYTMQLV